MKLIIEIPEELYEIYKNKSPMFGDAGMDMIAQAIANGEPYHRSRYNERWLAYQSKPKTSDPDEWNCNGAL